MPFAKGYAANTAFGYQFPLVSCGATYAPKKVWGFADVAADGSACFRVPAEVPIYFLALDAEGRAVQRMRTFTHLMPGEVQGCVGCHADRNYALAPRPAAALTRSRRRAAGAASAGVGREGLQLPRGGPAGARPALRRVPPRAQARPAAWT